jgi:hypothetical protein
VVLLKSMRHVLLETGGDAELNASALSELLEGAISTVPPDLAERIILRGRDCAEAVAWRQHMGGDLFSSKVSVLFQELHKHKDAAMNALEKVCLPFCSCRSGILHVL